MAALSPDIYNPDIYNHYIGQHVLNGITFIIYHNIVYCKNVSMYSPYGQFMNDISHVRVATSEGFALCVDVVSMATTIFK